MRSLVRRAWARQRARQLAIEEWNRVKDSSRSAALYYFGLRIIPFPLCWPTPDGGCGCGVAPLVSTKFPAGSVSGKMVTNWLTKGPMANIGILLKPSKVIAARTGTAKGATNAESCFGTAYPYAVASSHTSAYMFPLPSLLQLAEEPLWNDIGIEIQRSGYLIVPPSRRSHGGPWKWRLPPGVGLSDLPLAPGSNIDRRQLRRAERARLT